MSRIAIEALGIHDFGGGRTATLTLLEALFAIDTENQYLVILSQYEPSLTSDSGNVRQWIAPFKNRFILRIWAQLLIPFATRGYDLVHFVKNLGVFGIKPPNIVTIYDMTTLVYPELFPHFDVWYWQHIQKHTLYQADAIISISNTTTDDLIKFYQLPQERIQVIYPAYASHFKPAPASEINRVRQRYGLPEQYLIHLGRIDRKKNLTLLVQAFDLFRKKVKFCGKLVLAGEIYQKSKDIALYPEIERLGLSEEVVFTGRVPDQDAPALYSGAFVAVYPSFHEGFGLAPVEAMACGTPLIAHSAGALREIVGDAAIILDSANAENLAEAIIQVYQNPEFHQEMRGKGLSKAEKFRGEYTARQTLGLYREIINR